MTLNNNSTICVIANINSDTPYLCGDIIIKMRLLLLLLDLDYYYYRDRERAAYA